MTTKEAAARYEAEHIARWADKGYAFFNPALRPLEELPVIYGFNNGGGPFGFEGVLIAQDGIVLGGHACSTEAYMPHDLGILEESRPDRHETFRKHYPNGYRMEFVPYADVPDHAGLTAAFGAYISKE